MEEKIICPRCKEKNNPEDLTDGIYCGICGFKLRGPEPRFKLKPESRTVSSSKNKTVGTGSCSWNLDNEMNSIEYVRQLIDEDRINFAIDEAKRLLELNVDARNLCRLGVAYTGAGKMDEALANLKAAIALDPKNPDFLFYLAEAQIKNKNYQAAIRNMQKVIKISPKPAQYWGTFGWALVEAKRYEEAVPVIRKSMKFLNENFFDWFNLGRAYAGLGKKREALYAFEIAKKMSPDNPKVLNELTKLKK